MELKINKIPQHYFADSNQYKLELCRRKELRQRQEEMTQYLDEIEVVLFAKSGKYPQKATIILNNIAQLQQQADLSLKKVKDFRECTKAKISKSSVKQLKIRKLQEKIVNIEKVRDNINLMKKMRDLKHISQRENSRKDYNN